jgi:hypothetical protein
LTRALQSPPGYAALLKEIKDRIRTAQMRAVVAVNRELPAVQVDWPNILDRQQAEGWGTKIIERLAKDLGAEFPASKALVAQLKHMRAFAETCRKRSLCNRRLRTIAAGHRHERTGR